MILAFGVDGVAHPASRKTIINKIGRQMDTQDFLEGKV